MVWALGLLLLVFSFFQNGVNDYCGEPLSGSGGIELLASHQESFTCTFTDYKDSAAFIAKSTYTDSQALLTINGRYNIYGIVKASDCSAVINGTINVMCAGNIEFNKNVTLDANSYITAGNDSHAKFGPIMADSSNIIIENGLSSNLWFASLEMINSTLHLTNHRFNYPVEQMIYCKFHFKNSVVNFDGSISQLESDSFIVENSQFSISSDLIDWKENRMELIDSFFFLNTFQTSHRGSFVVKQVRSRIVAKSQSTWYLSHFDLFLSDSAIQVDSGRFFLSDYSMGGLSRFQAIHSNIEIDQRGYLEISGPNVFWEIYSVRIRLAENAKFVSRSLSISNRDGMAQINIIISEGGTLELNGNSKVSFNCELIGNITVPINGTYTELNVTESLNCTSVFNPTVVPEANIIHSTVNQRSDRINPTATFIKSMISCPEFYHSNTSVEVNPFRSINFSLI